MNCLNIISAPGKKLVLLIDPDKLTPQSIIATLHAASEVDISMVFVGGSLMSSNMDQTVELIRTHTRRPVVLFPGSPMQLSQKADALLLLSLVSGRNPEYLIGNHVQAAPYIRNSNLEVIPVGYILIDGGKTSSVEYISNTMPIPADKPDLAVATCIASEMLGHKLIYLEAGSGAVHPVPSELIREVKKSIQIPLIVGGGLNTPEKVEAAYKAGADVVVVGNAIEKNIMNLELIGRALKSYQ